MEPLKLSVAQPCSSVYTLKYTPHSVKYVLVQSSIDVVVSRVFFPRLKVGGMCAAVWARHARYVLGELLRIKC